MVQRETKYSVGTRTFGDSLFFPLKRDSLGIDVIRLVNERFPGHAELVIDRPHDTPYFRTTQPIGYSNSWLRYAVGPIVRELVHGAELIGPGDSQKAIRAELIDKVEETYENLGIIVFGVERQDELKQHLVNQARDRNVTMQFPMVFHDLKTIKDPNFPKGLRFDLGDNYLPYHTQIPRRGIGGDFPIDHPSDDVPQDILFGNGYLFPFYMNDERLFITGFPREMPDYYNRGYGSDFEKRITKWLRIKKHGDGLHVLTRLGEHLIVQPLSDPYHTSSRPYYGRHNGQISFKIPMSGQDLEATIRKTERSRK